MPRLCLCALFALVVASVAGRAQAPAPAARQGGPGGGGQFAGQTPISALIITGGCCHDYTGQSKVLMDTLNFKELVTRGFRWALKKEPIAMPPAAPARRGGGPGRGAAAAPEAK
jgi:hypothetical protein